MTAINPDVIEYERALIGGCLADTRGCRVWPPLRPEEFLLERHRIVWQTMLDLTETTDHPTLLDVTTDLTRTGMLDVVGGVAEVAQMVEAGAHVFDFQGYGRRIREAATERARIAFGKDLAAHPQMTGEALERAMRTLESTTAIPSLLPSETFRAEQERRQLEPPRRTGLRALDDKLAGGVAPGQVIVIGGRTSHGKTAFSTFLARTMARGGLPVDYLALEESTESIHARWISQVAGIPLFALRHGELAAPDQQAAERAALELDTLPLTVLRLRVAREEDVLAAVSASRAPVVILDHLQQVITAGRTRVYELERVMGRLSGIAASDRKVILVTAQVGRGADQRGEAPQLADLRDSGAIEQIARQVWLLYWPARHKNGANPAEYEVNVAKNSEGPTGVVHLTWDPRTGRFA